MKLVAQSLANSLTNLLISGNFREKFKRKFEISEFIWVLWRVFEKDFVGVLFLKGKERSLWDRYGTADHAVNLS